MTTRAQPPQAEPLSELREAVIRTTIRRKFVEQKVFDVLPLAEYESLVDALTAALAFQPPAPEAPTELRQDAAALIKEIDSAGSWSDRRMRDSFWRATDALRTTLECAAPEAQREPTAFWLIERGPNQGQSPHCWWLAPKDRKGDRFGEGFDWTFTAIEATRYPSQKAAEAAAQAGYVTHYAVTSHSLIAPEAATLCPNGEPWDPNPDGIVPGQERGPRMDPHTGFWEESALSETPKWKTFDDYAKAQGIDAGRSRDEYAEVWKEARL